MRSLAVGFLVLVMLGSAAAAEPVAVLIDGEPETNGLVRSVVGVALEKRGMDALDQRGVDAASLVACDEDACRARLLEGLQAELALLLRTRMVYEPRQMLELAGWVVRVNSGEVLGIGERRCERCASRARIEEAGPALTDLVAALLKEADAKGAAGTFLVVRSRPSGARVMVDGVPVGVTELRYGVAPGPHRVSVDAPDHLPEARQVVAERNSTTVVDVELTPGTGPRARRRPYRLWKWIATGAGVALVGAGVALIVLEPSPYDDQGDLKEERVRTQTPGLVLTAAGAVSVAAGIVFWIKDARATRPRRNTVEAMVSPLRGGGLAVGMGGRF